MRIREVIEQQGMTTKEIADKLGISLSALNQNISGNPSVKILTKIAGVLNVPLWKLFASESDVRQELFASKSDVRQEEYYNTIICPNCGKKFKMEE